MSQSVKAVFRAHPGVEDIFVLHRGQVSLVDMARYRRADQREATWRPHR